eukprot:jgi/Antlo1/787/1437
MSSQLTGATQKRAAIGSPMSTVCLWKDCAFECGDSEELKKHLETHVSADLKCCWLGCSRFGEVQPNKYALIAHLRKHSGDRPFKCQKCSKSYTRSDALNKHLKSHKIAEKNLDDLVARIHYLDLELRRSNIKLRVAEERRTRAFRRMSVASAKCVEVIRKQLRGTTPQNIPKSSFWDMFLGRRE